MRLHSLKLIVMVWLLVPTVLYAQPSQQKSQAHAPTAEDILQKHLKAIDQAKLAKVQTATVQGTLAMMARNNPFTLHVKRPDMLRNEGRLIDVASTITIKGNKGYQSMQGQPAKEVPVYQLKNQLKYTTLDDPLYEARNAKAVLSYGGKDHRGGKTLHRLKLTYASGDSTIAFIDVNTNYLILLQKYSNAPGTQAGREDVEYSEFVKESSGIVLPHKIAITSLIEGIEATYTVKINKVTFNTVLLDKIFEKP